MKRFEITLIDPDGIKTHTFIEECVTFAEAASESYVARTRLGLDWKILSIRELATKELRNQRRK
jgi:hypothetical protein